MSCFVTAELVKAVLNRVFSGDLRCALHFLAVCMLLAGADSGFCQEYDTSSLKTALMAGRELGSAQATISRWKKGVNSQDWREEYECYSGVQQAKFSYQIMICTRELRDAQDLSEKLKLILHRFRFSEALLDEYPSMRLDLSHRSDPEEIQAVINDQKLVAQGQMERWEREVQVLDIDWAGMVEELQPLFTESCRRHSNDLHPSNTGIAHHLGYHRIDSASIVTVDANRASGTVVASLRDASTLIDDQTAADQPLGIKSALSLSRPITLRMFFQKRHVKRPPREITLTSEHGKWTIDSAPYR